MDHPQYGQLALRKKRRNLNRNPNRGRKNRGKGIAKKGYEYCLAYGGEFLILSRDANGNCGGYQSRPGLVSNWSGFSVPESCLYGPHDFKDVYVGDFASGFPQTTRPSSCYTESSSISSRMSDYSASGSSASVSGDEDLLDPFLVENDLNLLPLMDDLGSNPQYPISEAYSMSNSTPTPITPTQFTPTSSPK